MGGVTKQKPPAVEALKIGGKSNLLGVRLSSLSARKGTGIPDDGALSSELGITPGFDYDAGFLIYTFTYRVRLLTHRKLIMKIEAAYEVAFLVPEELRPSEQAIVEFGKTTAIRVVHPYARQTFHALSLDFGLPPFVADLIRVRMSDPGVQSAPTAND